MLSNTDKTYRITKISRGYYKLNINNKCLKKNMIIENDELLNILLNYSIWKQILPITNSKVHAAEDWQMTVNNPT